LSTSERTRLFGFLAFFGFVLAELWWYDYSFTIALIPLKSRLDAGAMLGYQGLGLMLLFLSAHMYLGRQELRFPNVLLLIPVALVAIWLLNVVRIALLMVIGASWSPDIAVGGFHAGAGWLNLTLVALATVWATRRFAWFSGVIGNEGQIPIFRAAVGGERAEVAMN
jgi:exosortase/archaeosortase family protein